MSPSKIWLVELRRVGYLLLGALLLGWLAGKPLLGLVISLAAILCHWLYQLLRIQTWLSKPEGAPPEGYAIWGDIFDRIYHLRRKEKEARQELQSAVDYLQDSFASMHDGAVMVDSTGAIQWSNQASQQLLGLHYPQDRGQGILNLVRIPEFHHYFTSLDYDESLQISAVGEVEQFLQVDITRFGQGDRLIFIRDVTDVVRMEQVRRDFVANVSHELRTPLTVITGYLDTILDNAEAIDDKYVKPLEQMSAQSARMESLLKDLLWLSRIESVGKVEKQESIDIAALLSVVRDELAESHPHRKVELATPCSATVTGDYRELHSAVSNLLLNAIKYSPQGSTVTASWQKTGDSYYLSVRDTGQGIAAVHIPRLTERFYRVDDSRASATGGTGLGLAIVKHVAAAHSAQLNIESVVGVGSSFSLVFSSDNIDEASAELIS